MKKISAIILALALTAMMIIPAFAADTANRVYGDAVTAKAGETIKIPVKIEGNSGFMGFGITVSYDSSKLTPVSAEKGSILTGMMDDSIATSKNSEFKVIYAGSGNVTADGEIFTLEFTAKGDVTDKAVITLSPIEDDTFNESYDDVQFNCEAITVTFASADNPTDPTDPADPVNPDTPDDGEEENDKLSVRIRKWAASLASPFNSIMSIIVAPVCFVISLFE